MLCTVVFAVCSRGQQRMGRITGSVMNSMTREPLAGVNISLLGTSLGVASDSAGKFSVLNIPSGRYRVRFSLVGYTPVVYNDVDVNPVTPAVLSCTLVESPVQLSQTDVVAEYSVRSPDLPLSTYSLSVGELRRQPGGFDDVVRTVFVMPGVARVQAGRNDLIIRGGAPSENLYIVDGFVFPNINHFATQGVGSGPVSFVNVDFVDKTTFSSGGFGVRYGDKLSSVLDIDLRNGRDDRVGGRLTLSATQFGASIEGPLGDKGSAFLAVRRTYLDFLFRAAGLSFVPEYYDLLGKINYRLGPSDELSGIVAGALDALHLFTDTEQQRKDNSGILRSNQKQLIGGIALRHIFSKGHLRASLGRWGIEYDNLQLYSDLEPVFMNLSTEREVAFDLEIVTEPFPGTEIVVGGQASSVRVTTSAFLHELVTPFNEIIPEMHLEKDTSSLKGAAFAQLSRQLGDRLRVTLGGRVDYFDLLERGTGKALRASASYTVTPNLTLNGSAGRYYQSPSYVWLVSNPYNRYLMLIRLDCAALGLEHVFREDWKATLEGYLKQYNDYPANIARPYVVQANTGAAFDYGFADSFASFGFLPLISRGKGRARGIELSLQKKLSDTRYYGMLSLSISDVRFTAYDGIERPGAFDQRVIFNLLFGGRPSEDWEVGMRFRFSTGQPYTPFDQFGNQDITKIYSERFPPAHSLDVRVDRRWHFASWNLGTYVDIQNVYNRRNQTYVHYNNSTKEIEMEEKIGIIPTIGVIAEF